MKKIKKSLLLKYERELNLPINSRLGKECKKEIFQNNEIKTKENNFTVIEIALELK